jgi:FixJ family two-component response regulator
LYSTTVARRFGPREHGRQAARSEWSRTGRAGEDTTQASHARAGGLSNREIAQRLVVSARTVENHLYRACTKLGASDRAELAALLHGH